MTRLGRKPQGAALVMSLCGSEHAQRRMRLFLQTLADQCSVVQACAELGLSQSRFFEQRAAWLQGALELLEPRSPGRPPQAPPPIAPAEVQTLQQRIRELEARATAAEVQAELSAALPHVFRRTQPIKKRPYAHRPPAEIHLRDRPVVCPSPSSASTPPATLGRRAGPCAPGDGLPHRSSSRTSGGPGNAPAGAVRTDSATMAARSVRPRLRLSRSTAAARHA